MSVFLDRFVSFAPTYRTGEVVRVRAQFSELVSVDTRAGVPIVVFNNGALGRYVAGSGTDSLIFEYVVGASDRPVDSLKVLAVAENGAVLSSATGEVDVTVRRSGAQANDTVLSETATPVSLSIDTLNADLDLIPPKLLSVTSKSGVYRPGDVAEFTVAFNEVVRIDLAQGAGLPTLGLLSGGELLPVVASYAGGSGTKSLRFRYEVAEGDPVAGDINIASFDLNGGRVTDLSGNVADVAIVAGQNDLLSSVDIAIAGDGSTTSNPDEPTGPADTTAPVIGNVVCTNGNGTFYSGDVLTFELKLSE